MHENSHFKGMAFQVLKVQYHQYIVRAQEETKKLTFSSNPMA